MTTDSEVDFWDAPTDSGLKHRELIQGLVYGGLWLGSEQAGDGEPEVEEPEDEDDPDYDAKLAAYDQWLTEQDEKEHLLADTDELRKGRCYELAGFALLLGTAPEGTVLVHGTMDGGPSTPHGRMGHAWLVLPNGLVWEPRFGHIYTPEQWENFASPTVERSYTKKEAAKRMRDEGHWGRWHVSLYP